MISKWLEVRFDTQIHKHIELELLAATDCLDAAAMPQQQQQQSHRDMRSIYKYF